MNQAQEAVFRAAGYSKGPRALLCLLLAASDPASDVVTITDAQLAARAAHVFKLHWGNPNSGVQLMCSYRKRLKADQADSGLEIVTVIKGKALQAWQTGEFYREPTSYRTNDLLRMVALCHDRVGDVTHLPLERQKVIWDAQATRVVAEWAADHHVQVRAPVPKPKRSSAARLEREVKYLVSRIVNATQIIPPSQDITWPADRLEMLLDRVCDGARDQLRQKEKDSSQQLLTVTDA